MHHISDQHSVPSHCPLQSPGKQSVHNNDSCQETLPKPFTCTAISVQSRAVQSSTPGWHSEHTITMQTQCLSNLLTGHRMAMTQQNLVCTQLSSTGTETETGMGGHCMCSTLCVCVCGCGCLCVCLSVWQQAQCCGVSGPDDFLSNKNLQFNFSHEVINPKIPPSCCKREYINRLDWDCAKNYSMGYSQVCLSLSALC